MTTVGVDWLLKVCVSSRATAIPESMLRSSNWTPRCVRKSLTQTHGGQSCWVKTMTLRCNVSLRQGRLARRRAKDTIDYVGSTLLRFVEVSHLQLAQ